MNLDNLLKTEKVYFETLGKEVEIRELSYGAQMRVVRAQKDDSDELLIGAITMKFALNLDQTEQEIADKVPIRVIQEVTDAVTKLMDADSEEMEKN